MRSRDARAVTPARGLAALVDAGGRINLTSFLAVVAGLRRRLRAAAAAHAVARRPPVSLHKGQGRRRGGGSGAHPPTPREPWPRQRGDCCPFGGAPPLPDSHPSPPPCPPLPVSYVPDTCAHRKGYRSMSTANLAQWLGARLVLSHCRLLSMHPSSPYAARQLEASHLRNAAAVTHGGPCRRRGRSAPAARLPPLPRCAWKNGQRCRRGSCGVTCGGASRVHGACPRAPHRLGEKSDLCFWWSPKASESRHTSAIWNVEPPCTKLTPQSCELP